MPEMGNLGEVRLLCKIRDGVVNRNCRGSGGRGGFEVVLV
jgi:hypothetical protein